MKMNNDDVIWFKQRQKRNARVRRPSGKEFAVAWQMLGWHDPSRRYVLVWRVPLDNPGRKFVTDGLMRIPFLAFADETIEDSDEVVLKILDNLMKEAAKDAGDDHGFVQTGKETEVEPGEGLGWSGYGPQ